jgi:hypothetical protein
VKTPLMTEICTNGMTNLLCVGRPAETVSAPARIRNSDD